MEPNLSDLHIEEQRGMWWKLKPLDTVGRAVKYCLRILHPPARLPLSSPPPTPFPFPFRPLLNTFDPPKILPSRRKPEVKRRRVYFTLTSPAAFILDFSPAPRVSCTPPLAWSIASTLFPRSYRSHGVCIGVYGAVLLLPGTLTFLSCETRAFVRLLFASIVRMKV